MNETEDYEIHWRGLTYEQALARLNRIKKRIKKVTFTMDGYSSKTSTPTFAVKVNAEEE